MTILAHSTDTWSLCDNAPSFKDNLLVKNDNKFETWLLEDTRQKVHQGMLDNCEDYFVSAAILKQAKKLLKPSTRPSVSEDWERKRNYLGSLLAKFIRNTFKYTTQYGVLPSSSHL